MTDLSALKYTEEHEWIAADDGTVTIGITDYAAGQLGDIVFVDLPEVGTEITAGEVCGEIESTKSVGDFFAPITGTVVEVNQDVIDDPSIVNSAPFEGGWLIKVEASDSVDGVDDLLEREAYVALTGGDA